MKPSPSLRRSHLLLAALASLSFAAAFAGPTPTAEVTEGPFYPFNRANTLLEHPRRQPRQRRGNTGVALMFQTSDESGALVEVLGRDQLPAANLLSQAIHRLMPNDTDLTLFLPKTPLLNVANIGGLERYHAPTDTIENADRGTLQHHGSDALSLARAFAAGLLPPPPQPDPIYFDAGPVVRYAGAWNAPLVIAAGILLALLVVWLGCAAACGRSPCSAACSPRCWWSSSPRSRRACSGRWRRRCTLRTR